MPRPSPASPSGSARRVDGNVLRVIARLTADPADIGASGHTRPIRKESRRTARRRDPEGSTSMMELARDDLPSAQSLCLLCPVSAAAQGATGRQAGELPVKLRRIRARAHCDHAAGLWNAPEAFCFGAEIHRPAPGRLLGATRSRRPAQWETNDKLGSFRHSITQSPITHSLSSGPNCARLNDIDGFRRSELGALASKHHMPKGFSAAALRISSC